MNTDYVLLHKFIHNVTQRFTVKYLIFVRRIQVFSRCSKCVFTSLFNTQRGGKVLSHHRQRICAIHVVCTDFRMCTGGWTVGGTSRDLLGVQIT
jgi:hypothetical protein